MVMRDIVREQIIAELVGEATDEDRRRLAEWRGADLRNEHEFRRIAGFWEVASQLHGDADSTGCLPSADQVLALAARRSTAREPGLHERRSRLGAARPWVTWAVAASLVVGIGLGAVVSGIGEGDESGPTVLATEADEYATLTLQDGTVVRLAPGSELSFTATADSRLVSLRGRAFFAVASRQGQSFRVRLPEGAVEAIGTRFDLQGSADGVQVAVIEGEVVMSVRGARVSVVENQVARSTARDIQEVRDVEDVYEFIDWLGPFLIFSATPMEVVAEEFFRRFGLRIEIADDALLERTITGWFTDQSPREMLDGVCRAAGAVCTPVGGAVRMDLSRTARLSIAPPDTSVRNHSPASTDPRFYRA
jgi:transmembrane sensor